MYEERCYYPCLCHFVKTSLTSSLPLSHACPSGVRKRGGGGGGGGGPSKGEGGKLLFPPSLFHPRSLSAGGGGGTKWLLDGVTSYCAKGGARICVCVYVLAKLLRTESQREREGEKKESCCSPSSSLVYAAEARKGKGEGWRIFQHQDDLALSSSSSPRQLGWSRSPLRARTI